MIAKYHPSSPDKDFITFSRGAPLTAPVHCHLQGGETFFDKARK